MTPNASRQSSTALTCFSCSTTGALALHQMMTQCFNRSRNSIVLDGSAIDQPSPACSRSPMASGGTSGSIRSLRQQPRTPSADQAKPEQRPKPGGEMPRAMPQAMLQACHKQCLENARHNHLHHLLTEIFQMLTHLAQKRPDRTKLTGIKRLILCLTPRRSCSTVGGGCWAMPASRHRAPGQCSGAGSETMERKPSSSRSGKPNGRAQ